MKQSLFFFLLRGAVLVGVGVTLCGISAAAYMGEYGLAALGIIPLALCFALWRVCDWQQRCGHERAHEIESYGALRTIIAGRAAWRERCKVACVECGEVFLASVAWPVDGGQAVSGADEYFPLSEKPKTKNQQNGY